jgi:hypothetical protein
MKFHRRTADALYRVSFGAFAYAAYEVVHPHEPLCPNIIWQRWKPSVYPPASLSIYLHAL